MRAVDFWKANGRFDTAALETAIMNVIRKRSDSPENEMLIDEDSSGCKVFVCAVKGEDGRDVLLRSYYNEQQADNYSTGFKIWEACRATSAATTFFDNFERTYRGKKQTFIDGDLQ
ncbi:hypothetical protein AOL_s00006g551 [Orbilia oligospora ATCC 24927]|uniref:Uncharacterized protein n=2 Tax=Orbilia oligospora TaxID=2813651 RepID=G1X100_ARTOA|nr:hypothetical protein AOL_s00006g551 [Orbilia oligospora ATCC 24927]EGX53173.1 hypothetical protein AOL_s00006g551 [Orbilia oligospora ATCC 24927]KAF3291540.1 hypothetical protein TWF970_000754 [Orbilia oligospora]